MAGEPVQEGDDGRTGDPQLGVAGEAAHGEETAVAAPGDGDALRVSQALSGEVKRAGGTVTGVDGYRS